MRFLCIVILILILCMSAWNTWTWYLVLGSKVELNLRKVFPCHLQGIG
jgi:hypothetical protein